MSLHVLHHECGHSDENGQHLTFWTAWCDCGWTGDRHWLHKAISAADHARRDYSTHIHEALGADGFYMAPVGCRNCGIRQTQSVLIGTPVYSAPCANCGQTFLKPDNDVATEDRADSKWLF